MRRRRWGVHLLIYACSMLAVCGLILLAACQPSSQDSTGGGGAEDNPEQQASPTVIHAIEPALTIRKGSTIRSTVETPILAAPTDKPKSVQPVQNEAGKRDFRLCSPLADTPLDQVVTIISEPYRPPPPGSEARHHGVDFAYFRKFDRASIEGAGVQSVMDGQVAAAIVESFPYGNLIIIETPGSSLPGELAERIQIGAGESLYLLYAHLERPPALSLGDRVEACKLVGTAGKSGNAGGAHLHFEARLGYSGMRFKEMAYYKAWATEEQRANYLLWRTSGAFRHFDPMSLFIN